MFCDQREERRPWEAVRVLLLQLRSVTLGCCVARRCSARFHEASIITQGSDDRNVIRRWTTQLTGVFYDIQFRNLTHERLSLLCHHIAASRMEYSAPLLDQRIMAKPGARYQGATTAVGVGTTPQRVPTNSAIAETMTASTP